MNGTAGYVIRGYVNVSDPSTEYVGVTVYDATGHEVYGFQGSASGAPIAVTY